MSDKIKSSYPRYVSVYDSILERIENGTYGQGEQLPGENDLARSFCVSRNTLRQALLLLHEDGYVVNAKGKGTFVCKSNSSSGNASLENIADPLVSCAIGKVDKIETEFDFRNISDKNRELFNLDSSEILLFLERIYFRGERRIGCSLILIPYALLRKSKVSIDKESLSLFYEKLISSDEYAIEGTIRLVSPREPVTDLMKMTKHQCNLFMFDDIIYSHERKVVFTQKLFMIPDEYNLFVERRANRQNKRVKDAE